MKRNIASSMKGSWPISDRIIMAKFEAHLVDITYIQLYALVHDHSDEELEVVYEDLQKALKQSNSTDDVTVMYEMNCKLGSKPVSNTMSPYGLGNMNEREDRLYIFVNKMQY
jgi:hypothetical protein